MINRILLFLSLCISSVSCTAEHEWFPEYFDSYFKSKNTSGIGGVPLFIYFTDTHISSNEGHSPYIINEIYKETGCSNVFWGGDAINAYSTNIKRDWQLQTAMFDSITKNAHLYTVHGNHDFTNKIKSTSNGYTYSPKEVSGMLFEECSNNIVRDLSNPYSCYYYTDDEKNKIRYVILDTNDGGTYGEVPWGYKNTVSKRQLEWLANEALIKTPANYGIIVISHIPVIKVFNSNYKSLEALLVSASTRSMKTIDGTLYDFTKMKDGTSLLMLLSGHHHHDMQIFYKGLLQVMTACDACYQDVKNSPFAYLNGKRKKLAVSEQVVDFCKYDADNQVVSFVRYGYGSNRVFHLKPVSVAIGDTVKIRYLYRGQSYGCYDASSKHSSQGWSLKKDVASLTDAGEVIGLSIGETTVYSVGDNGTLEFFNVNVVDKK